MQSNYSLYYITVLLKRGYFTGEHMKFIFEWKKYLTSERSILNKYILHFQIALYFTTDNGKRLAETSLVLKVL